MRAFFPGFLHSRNHRTSKVGPKFRLRKLQVEQMEARRLMAVDLVADLVPENEHRFDSAWFQRLSPKTSDSTPVSNNANSEKIAWRGLEVEMVPHEWIVQFDPSSGISTASEAAAFFSEIADSVQVVGGLGSAGQVLVKAPLMSADTVAQWMAELPELEFFEPNMLSLAQRVPNDPRFNELSGLRNGLDQDIDADLAWDTTTGKKNVVIGVIDTGVDYRHPDLADNIWTNPGEIAGDGIDNDRNGFVDDIHGFDFVNWDSDPMDGNGHGTHVAGTIAAVGNNGRGIAGVAWNSSIMAIQILNDGGYGTSFSNIVSAINYVTMMRVDYGVNVRATNNSWGGGGYSQALRDAIARSGEADILFVAAAGNFYSNNDAVPFYPAGYDSPNIISVAAVNSSGNYADFSNYGANTVDIAAPGVDVLSTLPGNRYGYYNGTSMAAPHVSGTIALAVSSNPELGAVALKQIVLSTVDPLSDRSKSTLTNGRVNANNAVLRAKSSVGEADRFGVWRPQGGNFFADTGARGYNGERAVQFGLPGDIPIAGDWDGDGRDTIGVFRPNGGLFFLDVNRPGYTGEGAFQFGLPGDLPVAGDWNGDGIDDVGVFRPSLGHFILDTGTRGFNGEVPFGFGLPGDRPIAGDWDGNGIDDVGVYRANGRNFFLDAGPRGFDGERPFQFNSPGDLPVVGDWDRDGRDNVGMFVSNGGYAILDTGPRGYNGEAPFQFGSAGDFPVSGIWNPEVKVVGSSASSVSGASGMRATYMEKDAVDASDSSQFSDVGTVDIQKVKDRPMYHDRAFSQPSCLSKREEPMYLRANSDEISHSNSIDLALLELNDELFGLPRRSIRRRG